MAKIKIGKNPSEDIYKFYKSRQNGKKEFKTRPNPLSEKEQKEAVNKIMNLYDSQQVPGIKPEHQAELQSIYQKLILEKKSISRINFNTLKKIHSIYIGV
ncbi:MAG: hypothetical protein M1594_01440 [Candidatus Marsarchaeota archaeon]|nr:hypothetical protein [Candidatus Marsarchaeota archaeon]